MSGHARARAGWFTVALLAAGLVLAPSAVWPAALAWASLVVVLALAPGLWLARRVLPEAPHDARVALGLLLSPFACALVVSLVRLGVPDPRAAARALVSLIALLAAAEALRPRDRASTELGSKGGWALAVVSAVVILAAHALNPVLTLRSDGAFHAGVVHAVLKGLPPEDPWFAGLPLRYFWGVHAWIACGTALVPSLPPVALLPVSGAFAAASAVLAASALVTRPGVPRATAPLAGALVLAGTAPFAWVALAVRGLTGETRGFDLLLGHGAERALRALDPGLLHPSLVLPFDKFMVVTPFAWGLAGALLVASRLEGWFAEPSVRHGAAITLTLAAVLALHPVAGVALVIAASCAIAVSGLAGVAPRRGVALALVWTVLAGVVLAPPLRLFASGGGEAATFRIAGSFRGLVSALAGGALLLPFAARELRAREHALARLLPGVLLLACVVPALVVQLGGDNQSKFLNLAFALAAPLAAAGLGRWAASVTRRRILLAGVLAAWLPALAAMGWAYAMERDSSADAPSRPPALVLEAFGQESAPDAIVVDATLDPTRGAAPALPALTGRSLLWGGRFMARKWGHPAAALSQRQRIADSIASGYWPEGEDGAWLRSTGREVWLIAPAALLVDPAAATVVARTPTAQLVRFTRP